MSFIAVSLFTALLSFVFQGPLALGRPAQIVVLRHAEKPPRGPELSEKGWLRARALPNTFTALAPLKEFESPSALFGMSPSRPGRSIRSIQTLLPLSEAAGVRIETRYRGRDYKRMVRDILADRDQDAKQVVICWRREEIPAILEAFGAPEIEEIGPDHYDQIWILTQTGDAAMSLSVLRQP